MRSRILVRLFLAALLVMGPIAFAQQYNLFQNPHVQFLDTSGRPLAGGRVYTYAAGTTTQQPTWQDAAGTIINTNPIILDSGGFGTVYLSAGQSYKIVMKNSQGVQQWSVDNVSGSIASSAVPLNSILPAVGTNTINNGSNQQNWQWQMTGPSPIDAFVFTESSPSTIGGGDAALVGIGTLTNSTLWPLRVANSPSNGFGVTPQGNVTLLGTARLQLPSLTGTCLGTDASGFVISQPCVGAATNVPLSGLTNATGDNQINNGQNVQAWTWQLTGSQPEDAFSISESAASTNNASDSALMDISTLAGSTIWPLRVSTGGTRGFGVTPQGDIQVFTTSRFIGPLTGNVIGNLTGNASTATALATVPPQCTGGLFSTGIQATGNANCAAVPPGFTAGGDLTGTAITQQVTGIRSTAVPPLSQGYLHYTGTGFVWDNPGAGNITAALSAITAATASNTISNAAFTQTWNWVLTGANNGFVIGEGSAGAGTGDLVQINGLSNSTVALSVLNPSAVSQIHFGPNDSVGAWLFASLAGGVYMTSNAKYVNNNWVAQGVNPSYLTITGGGMTVNADFGKTIGATYTPTQIAGIASVGPVGQTTQLLMSPAGTNYGAFLVANTGSMNAAGGAYQNAGGGWVAATTTAGIVGTGAAYAGATNFYSNTGLTPGNTFTPALSAAISSTGVYSGSGVSVTGNTTTGTLNVTTNSTVTGTETAGRLAVSQGVTQAGGMKHERFTSCTTGATSPNASCTGGHSWATTFADANFTVACTPIAGGSAVAVSISLFGLGASGFSYDIFQPGNTTGGLSFTVDCIAMHD